MVSLLAMGLTPISIIQMGNGTMRLKQIRYRIEDKKVNCKPKLYGSELIIIFPIA